MLEQDKLYSIKTILEEYALPVSIQKVGWDENYYFKVEEVEGDIVKGTTYKNGKIKTKWFGGAYHYNLNEYAYLYGENTSFYDEEGFDELGFNRKGFNRAGYDVCGYDSEGYDKEGYDKEGYNSLGLNKHGFDRYGFDHEGYDINGYNKAGFDKYGFNCEGYDIDGYNKAGFDRYGFNHEGYDINGYNKAGFNINGFNKDGYDISGYNRAGLNKNGYLRDGYNLEGYDKYGFNRRGYNKDGYNRAGYNQSGFNMEGFDHEGYDSKGYNKHGKDRNGNINPEYTIELVSGKTKLYHDMFGVGIFQTLDNSSKDTFIYINFESGTKRFEYPECMGTFVHISHTEKTKQKEDLNSTPYGKAEIKKEKSCLDRTLTEIRNTANRLIERVKYHYEYCTHEYYDPKEGWVSVCDSEWIVYEGDSEIILEEIHNLPSKNEPYFAKVDYKVFQNMYIGKKAFENKIIDWADPRASLYYDFPMYIDDSKFDLTLVRAFDFNAGKYYGFIDKYNKSSVNSDNSSLAFSGDNFLRKIILAQRKNKVVHDIISSIQKNQYSIITTSLTQNVVVQGCAGSGKTMILLHRLRYLMRNNPFLTPQNIFAVAPTKLLNIESNQLAGVLQLSKINRFSSAELYDYYVKKTLADNKFYSKYINVNYLPNHYLPCELVKKLYSKNTIKSVVASIISILEDNQKKATFIKNLRNIIEIEQSSLFGSDVLLSARQCDFIQKAHDKFVLALSECKSMSLTNVNYQIRFLRNKNNGDSSDNPNLDEKQLYKIKTLEYLQTHPELLGSVTKYEEKNKSSTEKGKKHVKESSRTKTNIVYVRDYLFNKMDDFLQYVSKSSFYRIELGKNPTDYFYKYDKLFKLSNRISDIESDENTQHYLLDIIAGMCVIQKHNDHISFWDNFEWESFWRAYIVFSIVQSTLPAELVFVDEFQDYSQTEICFLFELFKGATFNFYGDFNQGISPKGISHNEFKDIISAQNFKSFSINENYRNALEITEYVNALLNKKMLPIGLHGNVAEKQLDSFMQLEFDETDRIALIVKSIELFPVDIIERYQSIIHFVQADSNQISRGQINVIPISMAKGLEFETVAVLYDGMSDNELYVAMTRALNTLFVLNDNASEPYRTWSK